MLYVPADHRAAQAEVRRLVLMLTYRREGSA
jgi:hypothetical protein